MDSFSQARQGSVFGTQNTFMGAIEEKTWGPAEDLDAYQVSKVEAPVGES